MSTLTVRLYADGPGSLQTETLIVCDAAEARAWASAKIAASDTYRRARIYDGPKLLSEVGYRINRLPG